MAQPSIAPKKQHHHQQRQRQQQQRQHQQQQREQQRQPGDVNSGRSDDVIEFEDRGLPRVVHLGAAAPGLFLRGQGVGQERVRVERQQQHFSVLYSRQR